MIKPPLVPETPRRPLSLSPLDYFSGTSKKKGLNHHYLSVSHIAYHRASAANERIELVRFNRLGNQRNREEKKNERVHTFRFSRALRWLISFSLPPSPASSTRHSSVFPPSPLPPPSPSSSSLAQHNIVAERKSVLPASSSFEFLSSHSRYSVVRAPGFKESSKELFYLTSSIRLLAPLSSHHSAHALHIQAVGQSTRAERLTTTDTHIPFI